MTAKGGWKSGAGSPEQRAEIRDWQRQALRDLGLALTPGEHLAPAASEQLRELVTRCERELFGPLASLRADDWYVQALAALCGAAERLRWAARHPYLMGDWPALIEAARLLGRAEHAIQIGRERQRKTGRPLGYARDEAPKSRFIIDELSAAPDASSAEIARRLERIGVDRRQVSKVRSRLRLK